MAYLLYCGDSELGDRLERVLDGLEVRRVTSRRALLAPSMGTRAAVVAMFGAGSDQSAEQLTGQCRQYGGWFHRFCHIQKTVYNADNPRVFAD